MDDTDLLDLISSPAASDPIRARTVAAFVAEEIAALGRGDSFDPEAAAALVASQEHRFRPQPPECLVDELYRLRDWQRLVAAARDRRSGLRRRLLESFGYDLNGAVASRALLITEPVGTLSGGWGFDRPSGPPCVLLTAQLPPDLQPQPDAGLPFPLWRERHEAEAALADLRARPPAPGYGDSRSLRVCWTCFQAGDPEAGHIVVDEDFWASR